MFGVVANAARHEPEAVAALHSGQDGRFGRMLRLPKPEAYSPVRADAARAEAVRRAEARRQAGREMAARTRSITYDKGRAERGNARTPDRGVRQQRSSGGRAGERGFRR